MSEGGTALRSRRGDTIIAPGAIGRVASAAAAEVEGVHTVSHSGIGALTPGRPSGGVDATPDHDRGTVELELTVTLQWPRPALEVTTRLRGHVSARVQEMTDLRVTRFDIDVAGFELPARPSGRVG